MSYDLIFASDTDDQLDPGAWENIVTGVREILGEVTIYEEGAERSLSHEQTGIQVWFRERSASVTVPYWHTGAEAEEIVVALYRIAQVVSDATGLGCLDPQLDLPLSEARSQIPAAVAVFDRASLALQEAMAQTELEAGTDNEAFHVYFTGEATLADAARQLDKMVIAEDPQRLTVQWGEDGPQMWISLATGPDIAADSDEWAAICDRPELGGRDRRFEVSFEDLDEVLMEINTMIEVQIILQELTDGYVVRSWNDEVTLAGE